VKSLKKRAFCAFSTHFGYATFLKQQVKIWDNFDRHRQMQEYIVQTCKPKLDCNTMFNLCNRISYQDVKLSEQLSKICKKQKETEHINVFNCLK